MANDLRGLLVLLSCVAPLLGAEPSSTIPVPNLSVYDIHPWIDGPLLGIAAAGAAIPVIFQSRIVHQTSPGSRDNVNRFDRSVIGNHSQAAAWASHGTVALAIAAPLVLDYHELHWSRPLAEDSFVFIEVLSINSAVNNIARFSVQRPRPETYTQNPPPTDAGSYLSFYAGHVATTAAALSAASMTYGYRYGFSAWPWVITGVVGVSEGALRSAAGKHFYTDDLMGLAMGTGIGILVPMCHRRHEASSLTLAPADHGAQLVWNKPF